MTKNKKQTARTRTYARNRAQVSRRGRELVAEADSTYFLKLVVVFLLATFWLKFSTPILFGSVQINAIPVGTLIGALLISRFEKIQGDRKIWYAVLLMVTLISYFFSAGIVI